MRYESSTPGTYRLSRGKFFRKILERVIYYSVITIGSALVLILGFRDGVAWYGPVLFLLMYVIVVLGQTAGSHRYFAHRSFEATAAGKRLLVVIASMGMGSVIDWAAFHRRHHKYSDRAGDAHSPFRYPGGNIAARLRNFFHAHFGWLFSREETSHEYYAPDLLRDDLIRRWDRFTLIWVQLAFWIPTALGFGIDGKEGALAGFLWGGCLAAFVLHNTTYSINSVCHLFGRRDYVTRDQSVNNLLVAVLGFGEGWHNTHHAFPASARFGMDRGQIDLGWLFIRLLRRVSLVTGINAGPTPERREERRVRPLTVLRTEVLTHPGTALSMSRERRQNPQS